MSFYKATTALVCTIAAVSLAGCKEEDTTEAEPVARPVLSMVVADVETVRRSTYPGRAIALQELNIGFEVPGKLIARPVDIGSSVQQGDLIAALDTEPYAARIRALEGQKAAQRATLENALIELNRRRKLLENGHVAQARVDDQEALVKATEASIEAIEGQLDGARINLDYSTLVAPFDGKVSNTYVENFQNVNARQPVLRLLDTSRIKMEIAVPESLINLEQYVDSIEVEFGSMPGVKVDAEIAHVGNEASTTTRTYPVTIIMDQPEGAEIQPGMAGSATANVILPADWSETGIQIPASAIFSPNTAQPEDTFVWLIDPDTMQVTEHPVTVKTFTDRGLLVSGLTSGDRIATAGVNTLSSGQKVRLSDQEG